MNLTLGGAIGYSSGRNSSRLKVPFSKGDCRGLRVRGEGEG